MSVCCSFLKSILVDCPFSYFLTSFLPTEPDPPERFSVFFVNITSVLISWTAYTCNYAYPSAMTVRYREEGETIWIERVINLNPSKDFVLAGQFKYKTVYQFSSRLKYGGRFGVYSSVLKMLSPGTLISTFFNS